MNLRDRLKLYVITDRRLKDEESSVKAALEGGATAIQLRIKNASTREMVNVALKIRKICNDYNALFFVNDRVDIALASKADGVHVGSEDMPVHLVKEIAPNLIVGASARSVEEAIAAERAGADYIGAGSVFPTGSKKDAIIIGLKTLQDIVKNVKIPVIAIGGINHENVREVLKTGVDGIAVISAIIGAKDVKKATMEMIHIMNEAKSHKTTNKV